MKYLKTYQIFESIDDLEDIKKNCQDILLPLSDKGVSCLVLTSKDKNIDKIIIKIEEVDFTYFTSEINHLLDYLHDEGFKLGRKSVVNNLHWEQYASLDYEILNDIIKYPDHYSIEFISMIFKREN